MTDYSIWLLEYSHALQYPVSAVLYGQHNKGVLVLPYCYCLLQSEDHTILVDTGFKYEANSGEFSQRLADEIGISDWKSPATILDRIGVVPDDIDLVILTHGHFDHAGNVDAFPRAEIIMQSREVSKWSAAIGAPKHMRWLTYGWDPDDLFALLQAARDGRLRLVDGAVRDLVPGIHLEPAFDTHTPGAQYVLVDDPSSGHWVLAGDDVYVYENVEGIAGDGQFVPIGLAVGSYERCLVTMEAMMEYVGWESRRIVPMHEARTWERFESREYPDGLHVAEICLRTGASTRLGRGSSRDVAVASS